MITVDALLERGTVLVRIKCPHCTEWHTHGAGEPTNGFAEVTDLGHRASHCIDGNRNEGYILRAVGFASRGFLKRTRMKTERARPKSVWDDQAMRMLKPATA